MLLEDIMHCVLHNLSPLVRMYFDIQIVVITNFVVVSSVSIKRVDCKLYINVISKRLGEAIVWY